MDLNKLNDYEFKETLKGQYDKIVEEINEFYVECVKGDRKRQIEEGLDVITSMLNYLKKVGITDSDFKMHIEKLERYKNTKYELGGE
ncbi:hypothetical protein IX317_001661 [Fusobacterium sp. DD29]|uniref:hypothetical protein n=1 Tax=unclassified Fusobacterium TaxID=2648384 RepID=UPI001B8D7441|nr:MULTISPECIES: hypothetical protein [unclassified Fusobacterium]MBR8749981.1 hypothetical protein [Fusobacterium sp. DD29]MBR8762206.1 hypothetical protein [Fusobacterium sp. DD25]MBR8768240.1 hypothetical protein [Fusobacterium sp. DD43]MBR8772316.1 hypothetical protein [Fusobacterium sp. DD40]MBR8776535.1 hypothetical protein [Fusobacterium sp. DD17]